MALVIVNHKVQDYDAWRPHFDGDVDRRRSAGITSEQVYRSVADPNDLYMLFEVNDPSTVEKMMSDPDLKKEMEEAGVVSQPVATVLNKA